MLHRESITNKKITLLMHKELPYTHCLIKWKLWQSLSIVSILNTQYLSFLINTEAVFLGVLSLLEPAVLVTVDSFLLVVSLYGKQGHNTTSFTQRNIFLSSAHTVTLTIHFQLQWVTQSNRNILSVSTPSRFYHCTYLSCGSSYGEMEMTCALWLLLFQPATHWQ